MMWQDRHMRDMRQPTTPAALSLPESEHRASLNQSVRFKLFSSLFHRQLFRSYANMVVSGNPYEQTLWLRFTVRRWRYFTGIELAILKDKTTALLNELWSANLPIRLKKSSFSAISLSVSIFVQGFSHKGSDTAVTWTHSGPKIISSVVEYPWDYVPWVFALEIRDGRFSGSGKLTVSVLLLPIFSSFHR